MSTVRELHRQAMDLAELAYVARHYGESERAIDLARQALVYETQAAEMLVDRLDAEPSRSVLYRSAASLALQCGEWVEAERLIAVGLAGKPPYIIADQLRELRDQI